MDKYDTPEFKKFFNNSNSTDNSAVTVQQVSDYIKNNQHQLRTKIDGIQYFSKVQNKTVQYQEAKNDGTITSDDTTIEFTGDVATILLSADDVSTIVDSSWLDVKNIFGFQDVFDFWRQNSEVKVYRKGANDSSAKEGKIRRPIHLNTPADSASIFLSSAYHSSVLDKPKNSTVGRKLLGQLLVYGDNFGQSEDSGSTVYAVSADDDIYVVGTFVGLFSDNLRFVVSPAEVLTEEGFTWTKIVG